METKRSKNTSVITLTFNILLLAVLLILIFAYSLPNIKEISAIKSSTLDLQAKYESIDRNGIEFDTFKEISLKGNNSAYTEEIIKTLDKEFYNSNIKNSGEGKYEDFMVSMKQELQEGSGFVDENNQIITTVLPSYSDVSIENSEGFMSDFSFINFVEALLDTFNLESSGSIGIKNVVLVGEDLSDEKSKDSLETNIFYIPLDLEVEGSKKSIINFLHYIENSGNISIDGDKLEIHKDEFLNDGGRKTILKGDVNTQDYNIYENQLIDIGYIAAEEYIDSSPNKRGENQDLSQFIKDSQGNEAYKISVALRFYVRGLPNYKLDQFISSIIGEYSELTKNVNNKLKSNISEIEKIEYKKVSRYLNDIKKDIDTIKKSRAKMDRSQLYNELSKYGEVFEQINEKFNFEEK